MLDLFDVPRDDIHDQYLHFADTTDVIRDLTAQLAAEAEAIGDDIGVALAAQQLA